jgi:ferredoxin-NADP reductase
MTQDDDQARAPEVQGSAVDQPAAPHEPGHVIEHPGVLEVVVEEVREEADGVVSLLLADPAGATLPHWSPGAHVDLILSDELERQYSLCGDPGDAHHLRVAVLREPESRGGSAWVHERVRAGDRIRIRGPRNNFPLVAAGSYVFVAGGIGITPLLTMIEALAARGADWKLVYGGRRAASMAFREQLARFGDRVTFWPEEEHGLIDLPGLLGTPAPATAVYCCGPEPLIAAVEAQCAAWPQGTLHVERFSPKPGALEGDGSDRAFEVVLDYSEMTLTVQPGQTIVDALEAAGIETVTSCREGTCGTCETAVLEGEPDHRDSFLTDQDREDNRSIMICCSRSKGPRLVLDL